MVIIFRKRFHLLFFLVCCLLLPRVGHAQTVSVLSPQKPHFAGQALVFHIQTKEIFSARNATVFYRARGITVYQSLDMEQKTAVDFTAALKAQKIAPPGVEYFFVVEDGRGRVLTFPKTDPKKHPYFIEIDLDRTPPRVVEIFPQKGADLENIRPTIRVNFEDKETGINTESIRLQVDGTDVTRLSEITGDRIIYLPRTDLSYGRHTVVFEMGDAFGNRISPLSWTFNVPKTRLLDNALAEMHWDGDTRRLILNSDESEYPSWVLQSSATLRALAEAGEFATSFDANTWYTEEEGSGPTGDPFNLNHFLYQARYGQQVFSLGDVTVQGTKLVSQSISRRGSLLEMNVQGVRAEAFAVRTNAVTGFEHGLGVSDPDQRLIGGSIEKDILRDGKLHLKATYLKGRNVNPDNYNVSTLEAGTEGNVFSLVLGSSLFGEKLGVEAEYCDSRYDSDVSDGSGMESDRAWRARVMGKGGIYDWEAGYAYLGSDFQSIANPTGVNDRDEFHLKGGLRALSSVFRLSLFHNQDNVDKDPLLPVIRNTTCSFNYNLAGTGRVSPYLHYTVNRQDSTREPEGYMPIDNRTQGIGGGFSVSGDRWSLSPAYTFTKFDDRSVSTNKDSQTHAATLAGSLRPLERLSISPSFSYTRFHMDFTNQTTETYQGTIGGVVEFLDNEVNLNTTLSVLENRTDDETFHTTTFNGIAQVNWHLQRYLAKKVRPTFSLRGEYGKTRDHITRNSEREYSVYVVFSFGVPIRLF